MHSVVVKPVADGWSVNSDATRQMIFNSGRAAEEAAVRVAEGIAQQGVPSEIIVVLPDGAVARRFAVPARTPVEAPEMTPWSVDIVQAA